MLFRPLVPHPSIAAAVAGKVAVSHASAGADRRRIPLGEKRRLQNPYDWSSIGFSANLVQGAIAMLDVNRDIHSLSNFKRNTSEFLAQLKETGHPLVLTINGKAELVVQDTASYQKLMELAERAERMEALRESVADMRAGRTVPAEEMLAEMRRILAETQAR
jgi:prevent-host-death family protein